MSDLTTKQRFWIEAYLATFNASEAARRAGYGGKDSTKRLNGWLNRRNPQVRAALEARVAQAAMSVKEYLALVSSIARSDLQDFLKVDNGVVLDVGKAAELGKLGLVKKCKADQSGLEVELYDRLAALALLARVMGWSRKRPEQAEEVVLRVVYGNEEGSKC